MGTRPIAEELTVDVAYSCEAGGSFPFVTNMRMVDADHDGRFGPGDSLTVFETEEHIYGFGDTGFNFYNCVSLRAKRGFNWQVTVAKY